MYWTAIGTIAGAVVGAAGGFLAGILNFRRQRRLWMADAKQRLSERRYDRLQSVLASVLRFGKLLDRAAHANRRGQAVARQEARDQALAMLAELEISVGLDRLTAPLADLAMAALDAYREEETTGMHQATLLQQDPRLASAPGRIDAIPQAERKFNDALANLRHAVLSVQEELGTPTIP